MRKHPVIFFILVTGFVFAFFITLFMSILSVAKGGRSFFLKNSSVAILEVQGPIFDSSDALKKIDNFKEDKQVKAVVVRIDSPGGAVAPSQEIFSELKKLREKKTVIVSMGTVAASGGYYIALAGNKIFASPGTITGSIGVIMESLSAEELLKWAKVESRVIKSGKLKDVGSPFRVMTPEERAYLQGIIDNMYAQFKGAVSEERHMPMEKLLPYADGRVMTGDQALQLGFIDKMGTLYDAIDEAKKMAGLPQSTPVIWPKKFESPFEFLMNGGRSNALLDFFNRTFTGLDSPVWFYSLNLNQLF